MVHIRRLLVAIALCLFVTSTILAQTYTRIPVSEFVKDPAKVAALQKAVATLRSRNTADPQQVP